MAVQSATLRFVKKALVLINIMELVQIDSFSPKNGDLWLAESPRLIENQAPRPMCSFVAA
jgi:hypothetical protein